MTRRFSGIRRIVYPLAALLLLVLLLPGVVFAHASVTKEVPEPNSRLQESPPRIELEFNERIEDRLYYIKVLDDNGKQVNVEKAQINATRNGLSLSLPRLPDGVYIVTFHVISADGHPIGDSYPITVGSPETPVPPTGNGGHADHSLSSDLGVSGLLLFASRIAGYLTLLTLTGWLAWSAILRRGGAENTARRKLWGLALQRSYLIALLFLILFHYKELLGEGGLAELPGLFTGTAVGLSWTISLLLSLFGFVVLQRRGWMDWLWIAALLAAETVNGHAMASPPLSLSLLLDFIHLLAACIWTGGLLFILVHLKDRSFLRDFLPRFSRAALLALLVLLVTGSLSTLLYLPKLSYLLFTEWGILLLIKIGLVLLVLITAAVIRFRLRKRPEAERGFWIKTDFALMVLIVTIVGLLTYVPPVPANQPLAWHEMGTKVHMSLRISPNAPGTNNFVLKVWLPETTGAPKQVELRLTDKDGPALAPITVPIVPYEDKEVEASFGFARYSYEAAGPFLPFPGNWLAEVRVLDGNADETVYTKEFRIY